MFFIEMISTLLILILASCQINSQKSSSKSGLSQSRFQQKDALDNDEDNLMVMEEVETLFIDKIDTEIADFEDLKKQMAVLDRHVRKHAGASSDDIGSTKLNEVDAVDIDVIKDELKVMRKEIIKGNRKIDADSVRKVNRVVDKADTYLESAFEKVYSALDDHLASDGHKNEHTHGDGDHDHAVDSLADYADLISVESEVDIEDDNLLMDYIDMEIKEFENIKEKKSKLAKHIKAHQSKDDRVYEHAELHLEVAENVLQELDSDELQSQEDSLQALKKPIKESHGKMRLGEIENIGITMEKAETFIDTSNNKLELVGLLDEEFEESRENDKNVPETINDEENLKASVPETPLDDGHFLKGGEGKVELPARTNTVEQYSTKTIDALKKAADESHNFLHEKNLAHDDHATKEVIEDITTRQSIACWVTIMFMMFLVIVIAVFMCVARKKPKKEEFGETAPDSALKSFGRFGPKVKSPELLLEKEVESRMSRRRWRQKLEGGLVKD